MQTLLERELQPYEIQKLSVETRRFIRYIDSSVLESYYDLVNMDKSNIVDLNVINNVGGRYYLHLPTGWVLNTLTYPQKFRSQSRSICHRIYFRNFISVVYDKIMFSKNAIENHDRLLDSLRGSRGLKKIAYRMVFCTRRSDGKSHLLLIARHLSVIIRPEIITSFKTLHALSKARAIAKTLNKEYPHVYRIDMTLRKLILSNEDVSMRQFAKLVDKPMYRYKV